MYKLTWSYLVDKNGMIGSSTRFCLTFKVAWLVLGGETLPWGAISFVCLPCTIPWMTFRWGWRKTLNALIVFETGAWIWENCTHKGLGRKTEGERLDCYKDLQNRARWKYTIESRYVQSKKVYEPNGSQYQKYSFHRMSWLGALSFNSYYERNCETHKQSTYPCLPK